MDNYWDLTYADGLLYSFTVEVERFNRVAPLEKGFDMSKKPSNIIVPREHPAWRDFRKRSVWVDAEKKRRDEYWRKAPVHSHERRVDLNLSKCWTHMIRAAKAMDKLDYQGRKSHIRSIHSQCAMLVHFMDDSGMIDLRRLRKMGK